jgi:undecaprenyl diphosphate synthase
VLTDGIDMSRVPAHVACIMDGNGRWATQRGLPRTEGHTAGEIALFDTENWKRPVDEVRFLLGFNSQVLERRRDELHELGVRVRFAGRRDWRVPKRLIRQQDAALELTQHNTAMTLTIAFNYGGRAEIVDAVRTLMAEGASAKQIDERAITRHLYDPEMPDPDLLVRTSGENRLSNFMIWQLAYAELVFADVLWPDFRRDNLADAVREYQRRERRFGG